MKEFKASRTAMSVIGQSKDHEQQQLPFRSSADHHHNADHPLDVQWKETTSTTNPFLISKTTSYLLHDSLYTPQLPSFHTCTSTHDHDHDHDHDHLLPDQSTSFPNNDHHENLYHPPNPSLVSYYYKQHQPAVLDHDHQAEAAAAAVNFYDGDHHHEMAPVGFRPPSCSSSSYDYNINVGTLIPGGKFSRDHHDQLGLNLGDRTYFSVHDHSSSTNIMNINMNMLSAAGYNQYHSNNNNIHQQAAVAAAGYNTNTNTNSSSSNSVIGCSSSNSSSLMISNNNIIASDVIPIRCQADGCSMDLRNINTKHYHRTHKVCELHSKATNVFIGGMHQRFCQQCSRFHGLEEFDDAKRSCRKRLADHNRRRRKQQPQQQHINNNNIGINPAAAATRSPPQQYYSDHSLIDSHYQTKLS